MLDTQVLRKKNRIGEKGMSTRYRSTMDYSIALRLDSGAITSRWYIVGDRWPEYDFERRRASLGWTSSHHWVPCLWGPETPPVLPVLAAAPTGRS